MVTVPVAALEEVPGPRLGNKYVKNVWGLRPHMFCAGPHMFFAISVAVYLGIDRVGVLGLLITFQYVFNNFLQGL